MLPFKSSKITWKQEFPKVEVKQFIFTMFELRMQQNCKVKELSQIFGYYFTTFAKWPVWCFSLLVFENRAAACVYLDFILYDTVLGENSHFWPKLSDCLLFFFFLFNSCRHQVHTECLPALVHIQLRLFLGSLSSWGREPTVPFRVYSA